MIILKNLLNILLAIHGPSELLKEKKVVERTQTH